MRSVIDNRQHDLTVIMENVHDPHNIAACLRSCDSVGITEVYILNTVTQSGKTLKSGGKFGAKSSASASKWLDLHFFEELEACFEAVRRKYGKIYSTHLSAEAVPIHDMDFSQSCALVFGNEKDGVTDEALALSDGNFIIPQFGMIRSLNISVACAVTVYEALRQKLAAGHYPSALSEGQKQSLLANWSER